jgi:hypothetical protein
MLSKLATEPTKSRPASSLARGTAALPDGRIERRIGTVRKTRIRLGRSLLLGLPQRLQNCGTNELRLPARASWSNPLQAGSQLIVYLYKE